MPNIESIVAFDLDSIIHIFVSHLAILHMQHIEVCLEIHNSLVFDSSKNPKDNLVSFLVANVRILLIALF